MPLGFEAWPHACQSRFGRQRQSGGPVPPHPNPLPWGEGWGEGELSSRRFHSARSSEPDTLQTRFQFLAVLDILVRRWACGLTITQRRTRMSALQSTVPTTSEECEMRPLPLFMKRLTLAVELK